MRVWNTGKAPARENMAQDVFLLQNLEHDPHAVLHLYDWWGESATFGHFINPEEFFDLEAVKSRGLAIEKRPTGGGIIFHSFDLTFSIAIPVGHPLYSQNTLESYAKVNRQVIEAVSQFLQDKPKPALLQSEVATKHQRFCMAHPTKYDVLLGGKKVGGAAQRRTRFGLLHQGSISLIRPCRELICAVLKNGEEVHAEMSRFGDSLTDAPDRYSQTRLELQEALKRRFAPF